MKILLLLCLSLSLAFSAFAADGYKPATGTGSKSGSTSVGGYTTKNGTYVSPHQRSTPDSNPKNNWSTKGNVNPYTGKKGTK